jgi:chemotaxis protein methyltransferase CheR
MENRASNNRCSHESAAMSEKDFRRLGDFIYSECGIKMPDSKKVMLEARLRRRLRVLEMDSFSKYCDYVFSSEGTRRELFNMIDMVTTNKTDFFREPRHFEYLAETVLPELINATGAGVRRKLMIWSAGCSTGEEPYTLAMVLSDFADTRRGFHFMILATDISTRVLEKAMSAIYEEDRVAPVPWEMKKKYLLRSRDKGRGLVRIVPALRETVKFRRLNFMEGDFGMRELLHIIFCRNVIIYFDRPTQERLLNRFCEHLVKGGYVFVGHSETLHGLDVPLVQVFPTIYRKIS